MSLMRELSVSIAVTKTSFDDIARLFTNKNEDEFLKIIRTGKLDPYLKSEPVLSLVCGQDQKNADILIRELVSRGADINFQDKDGDTPLHNAAWSRNPKAVNMLLDLGANPLLQNKMAHYPLNSAVFQAFGWHPYWLKQVEREKIIKDETSRVIAVVESLIIKGGNDPYKIYKSETFKDKSAISDCHNYQVNEAMKAANIARLKILSDKDSSLAKMFAVHQAVEEKSNKDLFIKKIQLHTDELCKDAKIESCISAAVYDPSKPLVEQVKKKDGGSGTVDLVGIPFSFGQVSFEPIKVAHRYMQLSATMFSGFEKGDDFKIHLTQRYSFTVRDYSTGKMLIDNISERNIESTMKWTYEYLLSLKKLPMHSFFKEASEKKGDVSEKDTSLGKSASIL